MIRNDINFLFLVLLGVVTAHAQLGFCTGSKGEPLFTETFGNGTTYGPPLAAGITTYPFVTGAPNDGQYTLYYNSYQYTTWHNSPDHTPDATDGPNGKMLLMNANATTSGDFYKRTVSGLCANTTFEFSAWLMNVYNPGTNYCGAGQIPINVRFEIWNASETALLGSGNTGDIYGSLSPLWQQFALVFTTVSETSVVLKMKNNGLGGCGNDLAIDDITFRACSDLTTVSSPSVSGTALTTCTNPVAVQLQAATAGPTPYFYQWQTSSDAITWTDVPGATAAAYLTPGLSSETYFRVKAAQDAANLASPYCSGISNVFTISPLPVPAPAVSNGNVVICSGAPIPALSVASASGTGVNWYDAPSGGNLLQSGSLSYTPPSAGTFYAETFDPVSNCVAATRTPVGLTVIPLPDATISGNTAICGGNTATIGFSGTPGAVVSFTDGTSVQSVTLDASGTGSYTTPALTATTLYTLTGVSSPAPGSCNRIKNESVTITVGNAAFAAFSINAAVCSGSPVVLNFSGTPNATVNYHAGTAAHSVMLDASGTASVTFSGLTATTVFTLDGVTAGTCSQALSQSQTVAVVPLPVASVSVSPSTICSGQQSVVSFTGTAGAVVTYQVNGGAAQTIQLDMAGTASVVASGLTSHTTYSLTGVSDSALACSAPASGSATITVNSLPSAAIATNAPVCSGAPATVTFSGTPNAVVTYDVSGSSQNVVLDAGGTASVTVPAVASPSVYTLVSVVSAQGCIRSLSQSVTVSALPLPVAAISASLASVCAGQSANFNFTGTPNAVVTYSNGSGNQTVTLNAAGAASVSTGALSADVTLQLVQVSLAGCSQGASGSATVSVSPSPAVLYSGNLLYCDGDQVSVAFSPVAAGTTFAWTVAESGVSGAAPGTGNQIAQFVTLTGAGPGTATYTVTPSRNGCQGNPVSFTVTVYPVPQPQLADGVICTTGSAAPGTQYFTLDTQLSQADGYSFQWFFGANPILGAHSGTYNATQTGTYTVVVSNAAGCSSGPVSAVVGQMPQGESLTITHSAAFADSPSISVTVNGGGGPFSYQLDDGPAQSSPVFHDVSPGTHTIVVTDQNCTYLTGYATIVDYPKFFTPNGDGFNDAWNINSVGAADIFIFDRYGKLLKQISAAGAGWDGTYNGHPMPSADYWFLIDFDEAGEQRTFRAHFSLKR